MFLLDKGANPGIWDMTGRTPLYVAVDMHSWKPRGFGGGRGDGRTFWPFSEAFGLAFASLVYYLALVVDDYKGLCGRRPL